MAVKRKRLYFELAVSVPLKLYNSTKALTPQQWGEEFANGNLKVVHLKPITKEKK